MWSVRHLPPSLLKGYQVFDVAGIIRSSLDRPEYAYCLTAQLHIHPPCVQPRSTSLHSRIPTWWAWDICTLVPDGRTLRWLEVYQTFSRRRWLLSQHFHIFIREGLPSRLYVTVYWGRILAVLCWLRRKEYGFPTRQIFNFHSEAHKKSFRSRVYAGAESEFQYLPW